MTDHGSYHLDLKKAETLEMLLHTYAQPLLRYAYTLVGSSAAAEDAMEDAFAALLVKGGGFQTPEQLRCWLYRTTRNKAIDHLRRHRREVPLEDVEGVLHSWDTERDVLLRQRDMTLYECMQELPRQYRDVLQLSYFEGFSVEQICAIQRKNAKQVYNLLSRARAALKERLLEEGINHEDLR